ncbi:carboxynorspermidine decarboxylase [Alteromonas halophila]|uniref:Carboxynorspermidine/carboxyspermidine decarboxylase n=1 Tax=Alteromonas halophila TaxID=516698 RepID=A0A918JQA7_9ALTE|nr:carboxynorspermidine decarboxylase [Alteromonas halophila]GGW96954.1 carboxynorspermidine/carboxyspermidine decarboxylase [Alteromonas halophila]
MTDLTRRTDIPSPCYVLEEEKLLNNLSLMKRVQDASGVRIILALKGFSMWSSFDIIKPYLHGATASSVWEARLAAEMGKEVHAYAPAYKPDEIQALAGLVNHLSFNSLSQWQRYKDDLDGVSLGLRINPEHQEAETPLYDPAAPGSRLGIRSAQLDGVDLTGIEGLHCHNLCECDSFATARTLEAIEARFGQWLGQMKWLNLGGGHLMTREGYDVDHLIETLSQFKARYPHLDVILEPGSAVAWQTGPLIAEVVDIVENEGKIALLDISATAHMPDVLEMPYRPAILNAGMPDEKAHTYRLGGNSCLAGDVIDRYSFDAPLAIGDRLQFEDMMHYTMVKTTFFNGVQHPGIGILRKNGEFELVRAFDYADFRSRLS